MSSTPYEQLSDALARAVADFGTRGVADPARLRAALVDLLGADARVLREEIEAVIAAANADIPEALRTEASPDVDALIARLTTRNVSPTLAAVAVSAWAKALEPFMSGTIEAPQLPTAPTIVPPVAPTVVPDVTPTILPPVEGEVVATSPHGPSRRALILAVAAIVLVIAIAGTAFALTSGGSSKKVALTSSSTTTNAVTPTTRKKKSVTTTTRRVTTTTAKPAPAPAPSPAPAPTPRFNPSPAPAPAPAPQPVSPAPAPQPVVNPQPAPSPTPVPPQQPKPKPSPPPVPPGDQQPTAYDIYTSIYSCWDGAEWQWHYLGMTPQLPAGWQYVTTPVYPNSQATNYGTLGYDNNQHDFWYQPDSRYNGNYSDAFYYAYKNSQGVWSTWGITHIAIYDTGDC